MRFISTIIPITAPLSRNSRERIWAGYAVAMPITEPMRARA
jgi:hypothetical protein